MRVLTFYLLVLLVNGLAMALAAIVVWTMLSRDRFLSQAVDRDSSGQRFDAAAGERWVDDARREARLLAAVGDVSADQVWTVCPPPSDVDGRLLAKVFDKQWQIVGYAESARGRNKARQIAVWRLKQAVAA